jgi:hypothetical protein
VFIAAHLMVGPLIPGATDSPPRRPLASHAGRRVSTRENARRQTDQAPNREGAPCQVRNRYQHVIVALPEGIRPNRPHVAGDPVLASRLACF